MHQDSSRSSGNDSARTPVASTTPVPGTKNGKPAKDAGPSSIDCSAGRSNIVKVDFQAGLPLQTRLKILALSVRANR